MRKAACEQLVLSLLEAAGSLSGFQKASGNEHCHSCSGLEVFSGLSGPVCLLSHVRKPRSVFGPASTLLADGAGHLGWFLLSDHQALASATVVQMSEPRVVGGAPEGAGTQTGSPPTSAGQ